MSYWFFNNRASINKVTDPSAETISEIFAHCFSFSERYLRYLGAVDRELKVAHFINLNAYIFPIALKIIVLHKLLWLLIVKVEFSFLFFLIFRYFRENQMMVVLNFCLPKMGQEFPHLTTSIFTKKILLYSMNGSPSQCKIFIKWFCNFFYFKKRFIRGICHFFWLQVLIIVIYYWRAILEASLKIVRTISSFLSMCDLLWTLNVKTFSRVWQRIYKRLSSRRTQYT